ncbi:MAG: hypothetical protein U0324_07435 [Polyangiales bacterium]
MKPPLASAALALALALPSLAAAQAPPGPMARARYSLPWNLRPAIAPNLLRVDHAMAFVGSTSVNANAPSALNTATIFTGGARPFAAVPDLGLYGRLGLVTNGVDGADTRAAFVNPVLFALWTPQVAAGVRLPVFLGVTVPVGPGSDSSAAQRAAFGSGVYTRQAMDNAMFAGNYFTVMGGAGVSWMGHGLTAQAEFTVLQLTRVWGESVDVDESRTNFTVGAHVGYQVIPWLTVSVEAHYQHWLSTPKVVAANDLFRSQLTLGGGVRGNFPVGTALLRPGVAFFVPAGGPMGAMDYKILQFDLAVPL